MGGLVLGTYRGGGEGAYLPCSRPSRAQGGNQRMSEVVVTQRLRE